LAPQRPPKDDPRPPNELTVSGGGSSSADSKLTDIYVRLGSVQASITYLEGHADDARKELKGISDDIVAAKATFKTLKWIGGIVGGFMLLFWGFIATILGMWAKHYFQW